MFRTLWDPYVLIMDLVHLEWVCSSNNKRDLEKTDNIACEILEEMLKTSPDEIKLQLQDNINWIKSAKKKLVVGSKARILYADSKGRINIALAFNKAIKDGKISAPIILGRIMMFLEQIPHIEKHQTYMMVHSSLLRYGNSKCYW